MMNVSFLCSCSWSVVLLLALTVCTESSPSSPLITTGPFDTEPVVGAVQPNYLSKDELLHQEAEDELFDLNADEDDPFKKRKSKKNKTGKGDGDPNIVGDDDILDDSVNATGAANATGEAAVVARIPYTRAPINNSYVAKDSFAARGMEHLYFITDLFLSLINRKQEMPPVLGKYKCYVNTGVDR